ncbi:MAG: SDR family oxidoreductase [bacterium]
MSAQRAGTLEGAAAFVTGASRGLGQASALALAEAGADLALAATNAGALEELAGRVREMGRRAVVCPFDLQEAGAAREAVDRAEEELGRLDIVVNAAGYCLRSPTLDVSDEELHHSFAVNVYGPYHVCRAAAPHMQKPEVRKAGGGRIVNFGSVAGVRGRADLSVYGPSKAAVMNLTQHLAIEWAPVGIRVNAISPGQFDTDMGLPLREDPGMLEAYLKRVPLSRMALPKEIGPLVVYLSSEESAFMTGSVLTIDGGLTIL